MAQVERGKESKRKLIGRTSSAEERERGGEAVKNYPHICVFVEGIETKA
jgi:hypothetical protein